VGHRSGPTCQRRPARRGRVPLPPHLRASSLTGAHRSPGSWDILGFGGTPELSAPSSRLHSVRPQRAALARVPCLEFTGSPPPHAECAERRPRHTPCDGQPATRTQSVPGRPPSRHSRAPAPGRGAFQSVTPRRGLMASLRTRPEIVSVACLRQREGRGPGSPPEPVELDVQWTAGEQMVAVSCG
jgi:hypothetical protein